MSFPGRLIVGFLLAPLGAASACGGGEASGKGPGRNGRPGNGGAPTEDASQGSGGTTAGAAGRPAAGGTTETGGAAPSGPGGAGGARGPRDGGTPDSSDDAGDPADGGESPDSGAPAIFTPLCTARSGPVTRISGLRKDRFSGTVMPDAILDATGATWDGTTQDGTPIPWVVTVNGEGPACWYGGSFPDCFRITSDVSVWNQAVSRWKVAHPAIR